MKDQRTPSPSCFCTSGEMQLPRFLKTGELESTGLTSCREQYPGLILASVICAPGPCSCSPPPGGAAHPGRSEAAPPRGSPHAACREGVPEARLLAAKDTPQTHHHLLTLQTPHLSTLTPEGAPRPCELARARWSLGAPPIQVLSASP